MFLRYLMYSTVLAALFASGGLETAHAADATSVRIAHLQIKPEYLEAFTAAVKEEMEAALRVEPGVLAIYAVADKNDPTRLTFIEIYADEDAYRLHRDTPHFRKYFHTTRDMIAERVLLEAVPVELRDKHNTPAGK
ncbi:MAG: antibiotic biosynthesis monooxygenase [Desulfovibrionaceae bacterium]|nr:antibiotic biosynthesis monooxygenase [Desulfovibrionaceae bacterium]